MSSLVEHLLRHARRFADLPLTSVPSAAVTDQDTSQWSKDLYDRDLHDEPEPYTGEPDVQPIVVGMRPRALRRRLGLAFLGAILAGCVLGTGVARADGYVDSAEHSYIIAYGPTAICPILDQFPSTAGVLGVAQGIVNDGFSPDNAVDIINAAVWEYCPRHWSLLERIGAEARGEIAARRII
jgi:hypothetical protein